MFVVSACRQREDHGGDIKNYTANPYRRVELAIAETLGAAGFPVATRPVKVYPV